MQVRVKQTWVSCRFANRQQKTARWVVQFFPNPTVYASTHERSIREMVKEAIPSGDYKIVKERFGIALYLDSEEAALLIYMNAQ